MGKTRMTAVDLRAAASELSHMLVGSRLQNIYDINPRTYLLKFGGGGREQKQYVLLEVGTRLHLTTFNYDKPQVPSGFTLKLRKHVRQWRLDSLRQLGVDRVIDFCFGSEDRAYHLLVEFYAKGNLILTDKDYNIIALIRTFSSEDARYAVRARYPLQELQLFRPMTSERLEACLDACAKDETGQSLKQHITNATDYGPAFVEHCLLRAGLKPNQKKAAAASAARAVATALLENFAEPDAFLKDFPKSQGYLVRKRKPGSAPGPAAATAAPRAKIADSSDEEEGGKADAPKEQAMARPASPFDDFAPVHFQQHQKEDLEVATFDTFNAACDVYFSALDQALIEKHNTVAEKQKESKLDKAKRDHQRRLDELLHQQESSEGRARLIIENADLVEQALAIVRGAVAQGVSWAELGRLIREQKRAGHPIATMIHQLHLDRNRVALLLTHVSSGGGRVRRRKRAAEGEEEEEE
eukprot:Hpha_TRINITY_DN4268_c0_g1::TRINITY_DN4268_c0_g1_i1::g.186598::m.186598